MAAASIQAPKVYLSDLPAQKESVSLRCRGCKAIGDYQVGRISIEPEALRHIDNSSPVALMRSLATLDWEKWVYFAGYFVCESCGSGGPWQITSLGKKQIGALFTIRVMAPERSGVFLGVPTLFDGTAPRTGYDAVQHLNKLIEAEPNNAFLWSRLGNTLVAAEAFEQSVAAFEKAVEIDPADVESLHSLGNSWFNCGKVEQAAAYYREVLRHCKDGTWRREDLKRELATEAVETLVQIHRRTRGKLGAPARPSAIHDFADRPDLAGVDLRRFDLRRPADVGRLVDMFLYGPNASPREAHARWQGDRASAAGPEAKERIGRNDPCPCKSGRKFKHCCMRK